MTSYAYCCIINERLTNKLVYNFFTADMISKHSISNNEFKTSYKYKLCYD